MLGMELFVAGLALFFHLAVRPKIRAAFAAYDTEIPRAAALALSPWLMPGALGFAAVTALVGLAAPIRRVQRSFLIGLGLTVASIVLVFAVWAAFLPLFQPA
jgi:hypothetical protein